MTDTRTLAQQLFAVMDGHRYDEVDTVLHPEAAMTTPFGRGLTAATWVEVNRSFEAAFPDGRHTLVRTLGAGEWCAIEGIWSGTHTGPMAGAGGTVPPTGRSVSLPFCAVVTRRDGRISALTVYFDQMAMLGQLGLVPQPAAAS